MPEPIAIAEETSSGSGVAPPYGMYLHYLRLGNFRSCHETTAKLQPALMLIVGENNSGKSNVIDAARSTNGEVTHFHDIRRDHNRSRSVSAFHTPTALAKMLTRDADVELARLATLSQYDRLRPYQREANQAIEEATKDGRRRLMVGECRYDPR